MSLRDQILDADDKVVEKFVTDWVDKNTRKNLVVWIRTLTAEQVERHNASMRGRDGQIDQRKTRGALARLIALAVVDENENRVFTAEDVKALNQKSAKATGRLVRRINEVNGFDDDDAELLGNFDGGPSDDSSSDLQDISEE